MGVIGNGAGLVMSTLDVVAYAGEEFPGSPKPANFLDIGGGASAEIMANGLEIIIGDEQVRSVFVNVFGGITACDAVANGVVRPSSCWPVDEHVDVPLVVRLDGNNAELGRKILAAANLPGLEQVDTMDVRPAEPPSWRRAERLGDHGNLSERGLEGHCPGHDRLGSAQTYPSHAEPGTRIVGGVTPGKGGQVVEFEQPRRSSTRWAMRWPPQERMSP